MYTFDSIVDWVGKLLVIKWCSTLLFYWETRVPLKLIWYITEAIALQNYFSIFYYTITPLRYAKAIIHFTSVRNLISFFPISKNEGNFKILEKKRFLFFLNSLAITNNQFNVFNTLHFPFLLEVMALGRLMWHKSRKREREVRERGW